VRSPEVSKSIPDQPDEVGVLVVLAVLAHLSDH